MCSLSFLIPIVAGLLLTKMLVHAFFWRRRAMYGGHHGHFRGGCGGHGRGGWRGRRMDISDAGGDAQVFVRNAQFVESQPVTVDVTIQLSALFGTLELAEAQRDEVDDVMALARRSVGDEQFRRWTGLVAALGVVGEETFDPIRTAGALGPQANKQLVDGLEHLHNILLPEQAEQLRAGVISLLRNSSWS